MIRIASLAAAVATLLLPAQGSGEEGRPSVLLLTIDTLRPDYLSANGYDLPTSPFLDSLLSEGFSFLEAVAPVTRTTPALASLLTGAYPHRTGVRTLTDTLRDDVVSVTEVLRRSGYEAHAVVTNWVLARERRLDRGFASYDTAHDSRSARETTDAALDLLATIERESEVFLWVHYIDPHVPYHTDSSLARSFDPDYEGRYRDRFGSQPAPGEGLEGYRPYPEDLPKGTAVHRNPLPERVNAHIRRLYAADIRFTDEHVARLVRTARERWPELLIVFASDHGESLGEHEFYFDHGDYAYQAGTRVPLAFVLPKAHPLAGNGRIDGWVSLVDVAPTLMELLELEIPAPATAQLEGRSLVPAMRGESLEAVPVFAECGRSRFPALVRRRVRNDVSGRIRSVIYDDWKLIWTPFQMGSLEWELYDLANDPHETNDLYAPDHPRVAALRSALREWMDRASDEGSSPAIPEEDLEALRALGYID